MVNEEGDKDDGDDGDDGYDMRRWRCRRLGGNEDMVATYLICTRRLGGLALGVPGLRLTMGLRLRAHYDMVEKLTDILLQRLGRARSISSWFVHPLSVGSGGCKVSLSMACR